MPAQVTVTNTATSVTVSGQQPAITVTAPGPQATTDLSVTRTSTAVTVASSTGTDATLLAATGTLAGVMTAALFTKLNELPDAETLDAQISGKVGYVAGASAGPWQASTFHIVNSTVTYTDPTPSEGAFGIFYVINGTLTLGGAMFTTGRLVLRTYHSGAWTNRSVLLS